MMALWSFPELGCGFLAAYLPVLPTFLKHLKSRTFFKILGSRIRLILQIQDTDLESISIRVGSVPRQNAEPWANVIITDPEFYELVHGTENRGSKIDNSGHEMTSALTEITCRNLDEIVWHSMRKFAFTLLERTTYTGVNRSALVIRILIDRV